MTAGAVRDLIVAGAGGFGRETVEAIRALTARGAAWRLRGYVDDDPALAGTLIDGVPVLGTITELKSLADACVVVCTGRPDNYASRPQIVAALGFPAYRYASIIHPTVAVSASSRVGPGSVLLAHTVLTAAVDVGSHVAIMPHVTLTHDDVVEDYATLASGVRLGGGVRVGRGAYVGAGALVREGLLVGSGALVGMGAVVTTDIPPGQVWAGVPARYLRPAGAGWSITTMEG